MPEEPLRVTVVSASGAAAHYVFRGDRIRIGRGEDNELHVPDAEMSRLHAELRRTPHGWELRDAGSTNGTRRNGRAISAPIVLQRGDEIGMGVTTVLFDAEPHRTARLDATRIQSGVVPAVDALLARLMDGRADFWTSFAEPYLRREISKDAARELVAAAWHRSEDSYKEMARILRIPRDHKRLLNFLNRHGLSVDRARRRAIARPSES